MTKYSLYSSHSSIPQEQIHRLNRSEYHKRLQSGLFPITWVSRQASVQQIPHTQLHRTLLQPEISSREDQTIAIRLPPIPMVQSYGTSEVITLDQLDSNPL